MSLLKLECSISETSLGLKDPSSLEPGKKTPDTTSENTEDIDPGLDMVVAEGTFVQPLFQRDRRVVVRLQRDTPVRDVMKTILDPIGFTAIGKGGSRKYFVGPTIVPSQKELMQTPVEEMGQVDASKVSRGKTPNKVAFRVKTPVLGEIDVIRDFAPGRDVFIAPTNLR